MTIISFFSGCGGLDLGFTNAGFQLVYANDNSKVVWETFEKNHGLKIDRRSIVDIPSEELPTALGIVGGPPCQSWSLAARNRMKGVADKRGQLFHEYIRVIKDKKPAFFVAENVPGIVSRAHLSEFEKIINKFEEIGYKVSYELIDARNYGVAQERRRVIIVGFNKELGVKFKFPPVTHAEFPVRNLFSADLKQKKWVTLREAIGDLPRAKPALEKNHANRGLVIPNHEFLIGGFSPHYLSRNRRKLWAEQSFTIQAGGRHAPLHPRSSQMRKITKDEWEFVDENPIVERLSVRECARIQTFPDDFIFYYNRVDNGYKMIGNAVPVKLAEAIAKKIRIDLSKSESIENLSPSHTKVLPIKENL